MDVDADQDAMILDSVERFLAREVKPHVHALEHDDTYPEAIVEGMKALGLFGATIGAEYGGLGLSATTYAKRGKADPSSEPRNPGMSLFLAEKGPGFTVSKKLEKLGYKGIDSAELVFADYRVAADRLIGGAEGRGLQHALGGLELGRINVAARGVGVARAALDEAISYSQIRKTFGKPICEHQAIQLKLADMATQVEAARLLTERAAQAYDKGERCDMEAGMAKLFASEAAGH